MKTFLDATTFRAVLFDIDNTLYRDTTYVDHQIAVLIERLALHRGESVDQTHRLVQRTREELERRDGRRPSLGNTFVALGIPIKLSVAWRSELIHPEEFLAADDDLRQILESLRTRFELIAITNNPVAVGSATLDVLGVGDLFRIVVGLDTCHQSKPAWGPFETALAAVGVAPHEAIAVGDRYDIDLEPIIVRGGSGILFEHDHDIRSLPQILGIVGKDGQ
jgi:FMN phosphatase YigB (HAD superfamily)